VPSVQIRDRIYRGGGWVEPGAEGSIEVVDPTTEQVIGRVPEGCAADVERAVAAARAAFESWSRTSAAERAELLGKLAAGLTARREEIARTITSEVGMPLRLSNQIQAALPAGVAASYVKLLASYAFEQRIGNSLVVREPIGVVGCITPWNYPLHQIVAKVAPALAAGCTVVVKPSEVAPLNAFILAEIVHASGLPRGVFNLVSGRGAVVGEALAAHADVDMISFTGSTRAGRRVSELAAANVKRVALELGGKSANVILDDADFERAVTVGVAACWLNSGQTCSAWTRMLVPKSRMSDAAELAKRAAQGFTLGDPLDANTKLGPLVSAAQRERVRGFIRQGVAEGARLVTGGAEAPAHLPRGWFVQPTVFADVSNSMTIAREEIFGPVLSILGFEDDDDAVRIANDTQYGLAGAVWSRSQERAIALARRLRTGQVDINGAKFNPLAPFGGFKRSGHGRELGVFGLEEFLSTKSLQI
jgi:betaine-aldehyde dehydrogenase